MTKEYKVVTSPRLDRFEETVSKMLNDGWSPSGDTFIAHTGGMALGMIKETKTVKTNDKTKVS